MPEPRRAETANKPETGQILSEERRRRRTTDNSAARKLFPHNGVEQEQRCIPDGFFPGAPKYALCVFHSRPAGRARGQAGRTVTGTPLKIAFPLGTSTTESSVSVLAFTPACALATDWALPSCPPPCGRLTTPGMIDSVGSTGTVNVPAAELTTARPSSPSRSASAGWICNVHVFEPLTSVDTLCSQLLLDRRCRLPMSTNSGAGASMPARSLATSASSCAGARSTRPEAVRRASDRKSTRLNSSHVKISYAVFCLKK